ncbi:MAG TPA: hypothetical protein VJ307_06635 [Candidatus Deferrimicrobiaceae bacterium]|nr:hypothetical protein [Candidatus Deferrimicrobiaceae bacterium]
MINAYLVDTVKFVRPQRDKWMKTVGETVTEVPARKVYKMRRILTLTGEEAKSELTIMAQDRDVNLADLVEVDGQRWAILAIRRPRDFSWGFVEVILGTGTRV